MPYLTGLNDETAQPEGLIALGSFRFSVSGASYRELQVANRYSWVQVKRVGGDPALQFTGAEVATVNINGVLFPSSKKQGYEQIPALKALADKGKPLQMVDGLGNALGEWVIVEVNQTQSAFTGVGLPKKIEFAMSLMRYARA